MMLASQSGVTPESIAPVGVISGSLAGDEQRVSRAELWAAIMALRVARRDVPLRIHSDCAYVAQGFERLLLGGVPRAKREALWPTAADLLANRRADTTVLKLRAHRTATELYGEAREG